MNLNVGFVPYLNMVPFHYSFGPAPLLTPRHRITFRSLSPRALGIEAEKGLVQAGALSLVDGWRLAHDFEPIGAYGIGVKRQARSVLVFSSTPFPSIRGLCAVTDETSTSFRLLQVLQEQRYGNRSVEYRRLISGRLRDESMQAMLLIGDEALRAAHQGVEGLPYVTDLAEEWFVWQKIPFVFARWAMHRSLPLEVKLLLSRYLEKSLRDFAPSMILRAADEAHAHRLPPALVQSYWNGFSYQLTPAHEMSIARFEELSSKCLTV